MRLIRTIGQSTLMALNRSPGRYLAGRLLPYWELFLTWQPGSNQKAGTFNNFATAIGQYKRGIHTWQKVKTFVI